MKQLKRDRKASDKRILLPVGKMLMNFGNRWIWKIFKDEFSKTNIEIFGIKGKNDGGKVQCGTVR